MEFKNTDDLFKAAFSDETAEAPAFIKVNIDKRLGEKPRHGLWKWLGIALLLTGSATAIILSLYNETPANSKKELTNISSDQTSQDFTEKNKTAEGHSTQTESTSFNSTKKTTSSGSPERNMETDSYSENNRETNPDNQTKSSVATDNSSSDKNQFAYSSVESSGSTTSTDGSNATKKSASDTGQNNYSVTQSAFSNKGNENSTPELSGNVHGLHPLALRLIEMQPAFLPALFKTPLYAKHQESLASIKQFELSDPPKMDPGQFYNPWMITAAGGVSFAQSNYQSSVSEEESYYNSSTSPSPGFEGNLDVRYRMKNSITLGSGIGFTKITEDYHFLKQSLSLDSTLTWTYVYDSLDTAGIYPIDSSYTVSYDSLMVTTIDESGTTKASYLSIPFSAGTQIVRSRFIFEFYLAGRFNYLLKGSGGYVANESFVLFDKNQGQIFKPFYWDLYLGTNVHMQVYQKLYVTGAFRFQPALGNIYQGINLSRSIRSYQISLGLSWKF